MSGRILVIDDSEIALELCRARLADAGFEVVGMTLGSGGITAASSLAEELSHGGTPPDLILIDVTMPEVSGPEVTKLFRAAWGITVPIYLWSDRTEEELRQSVETAGADGCICKSWGLERLVSVVRQVVDLHAR